MIERRIFTTLDLPRRARRVAPTCPRPLRPAADRAARSSDVSPPPAVGFDPGCGIGFGFAFVGRRRRRAPNRRPVTPDPASTSSAGSIWVMSSCGGAPTSAGIGSASGASSAINGSTSAVRRPPGRRSRGRRTLIATRTTNIHPIACAANIQIRVPELSWESRAVPPWSMSNAIVEPNAGPTGRRPRRRRSGASRDRTARTRARSPPASSSTARVSSSDSASTGVAPLASDCASAVGPGEPAGVGPRCREHAARRDPRAVLEHDVVRTRAVHLAEIELITERVEEAGRDRQRIVLRRRRRRRRPGSRCSGSRTGRGAGRRDRSNRWTSRRAPRRSARPLARDATPRCRPPSSDAVVGQGVEMPGWYGCPAAGTTR